MYDEFLVHHTCAKHLCLNCHDFNLSRDNRHQRTRLAVVLQKMHRKHSNFWLSVALRVALRANLAYRSRSNSSMTRACPGSRRLSNYHLGLAIMTARSARNVETQKKKARRKADRPKVSRPTGNTAGVRRQLKKLAGLRNGRAKEVATASE